MKGAGAVGTLLVALIPGAAAAQGPLADRIANADGDRVAFHFAVDDDVTVCARGFTRSSEGREDRWGSWNGGERDCPGRPLEVVVVRDRGAIRGIEMGPLGREARDVDLGPADAGEAARWLLSIHRRGATTDAAEEAMVGAIVARGPDPAEELLSLARDRSLESGLRRSALFWVSQVAARGIDAGLAGIAADEAEDQEVRDAAVFALSQRPADEAVPALIDLARTAPHAQTRRSALFWLSQADDDRVPEFFAELILGGG